MLMMHAETQSSQPQHEPVTQSAQTRPGSLQPPSGEHGGAHLCELKMHTLPSLHLSSSSHWPSAAGLHAATQSAQLGQLDVAQSSQMLPMSHESQEPP
jgi:hypothetical protein